MKTLQNFFKTTISTDWAAGTGNRYITTLPTPTSGWLVVSPNNTSLREIVAYTATGTDGGGNYITISARGVGGTTDQPHSSGEAVRMNITAEHWADIYNNPVFTGNVTVPETPTNDTDAASKAWVEDQFLQGAADAGANTKGISKVSVAPVSPTDPIAVGTNDYRVNPNNYAADAGGTDTYAITLTNAPASYVTGQVFYFKANTANTGTATLNVNSLGAKTIVRSDGTTLLSGDILASQLVQVQYDGTNLVMQSAPASTVSLVSGAYPAGDGAEILNANPALSVTYGEDIAAGVPVFIGDGTTMKRVVAGNNTYSIASDTFPTSSTGRVGQTFIAGMPRMTGFGLTINNNNGGNSNLVVNYDIYATSGGLPTGASLKNGTISFSSVASGETLWAETTFGSALTLTTGNTYALCIYVTSGNWRYRRYDTDGTQYVDGSYITESSSVWSAGTGDLAFMIFNNTATTAGQAYITSSYEAPYKYNSVEISTSNMFTTEPGKNCTYATSSTRVDGITKTAKSSGQTGTVITSEGLATITPPTLQTTISSTIDQQNTSANTRYTFDSTGKYAWFTFTTGDIDILEKIELYIDKTGTPGDVLTVSVMALDQNFVPVTYSESGVPKPTPSAVLGSVTYSNADISSGAYYSKTFSTPIAVKPRTMYGIFIQYGTYVATNYFGVYYNSGHSNYRYGYFNLNGTTSLAAGTFAFKMYTTSNRFGYIGDNIYVGKTAGKLSFFPTYDGKYVKIGKLTTSSIVKVGQKQTGNIVSYFRIATPTTSTGGLVIPASTNTKRLDVIFTTSGTPAISISFDLETGIVIGNNVQATSTGAGLNIYRIIMPSGKSFAQHFYIIFDNNFSVSNGGFITAIQYE